MTNLYTSDTLFPFFLSTFSKTYFTKYNIHSKELHLLR